ncbi:hypothetical protein BJP35_0017 [Enterobacter sp. J49]|uniref:hypothetical protein n=1 Tax=Enterobacter sp. J49 TaxID=1903627 RepID=UPI000A3C92C3|nr:hypothetical protein [Enterobacter sp. J49]OUC39429.1 hypothetical protein BJP35_0017 [Enterobacter sp. J49]
MKNQFLLVGSSFPPAQYAGWQTFWCVQSSKCIQNNLDIITISLPVARMPALSQALFALDKLELQKPLVISTVSLTEASVNTLVCSGRITAWLPEPNYGYMSFPTAAQFTSLAKEAMRAHNPAKGDITLEDVWCQVLLKDHKPAAA